MKIKNEQIKWTENEFLNNIKFAQGKLSMTFDGNKCKFTFGKNFYFNCGLTFVTSNIVVLNRANPFNTTMHSAFWYDNNFHKENSHRTNDNKAILYSQTIKPNTGERCLMAKNMFNKPIYLSIEQNTDYYVGDIVRYDNDKILSTEGNCLSKFTFEKKSNEISFYIDDKKYIFPVSEKQYEWIQKFTSNYKNDNVRFFETHNKNVYLLTLTKIDLDSCEEICEEPTFGNIVWSDSSLIKDTDKWECVFITEYKTYQVICEENTIIYGENRNKASYCRVDYDKDLGRNKVTEFYPKPTYRTIPPGCYCLWFNGQDIDLNTRQRKVKVVDSVVSNVRERRWHTFTWDTYLGKIKKGEDKIIILVQKYKTKILGKWEENTDEHNCERCAFAKRCDCVKRRIIDKEDECKKCDYWKHCNPKPIYPDYDFNEDTGWLS